MKIVFVGPTLADATAAAAKDIVVRPPAVQGDILRATRSGATAIGIIDGNFEYVAPIWHKEILFALSHGIRVVGAASMGALRAAECADFGMVGVGRIFQQYVSGELEDDSDVALLHGPAELGYLPLTLPLVNVLATLEHLQEAGGVSPEERAELEGVARRVFYKERTWSEIIRRAQLSPERSKTAFVGTLKSGTVDQKREDALELLDLLAHADNKHTTQPSSWTFQATSMWKTVLNTSGGGHSG